MKLLPIVGCILALGVGVPAWASPASIARGQRLAQSECRRCHAIAAELQSPVVSAPRFADLERLSSGRGLEEIVADGLMLRHPTMPTFLGDEVAMADLLDYIRSVQARPAPPAP